MKKKAIGVCVIIIGLSLMSGSSKKTLPDLPSDAVAFEVGSFVDQGNDAASFITIEYNGRTYIQFGTRNNKYKQSCVDSCVGYLVQNEHLSSVVDLSNTNWRIYTLSVDPKHNFLMDFDDSVELMNQPVFWRAVDTNGKDIEIPDYIDSFSDAFWGEQ